MYYIYFDNLNKLYIPSSNYKLHDDYGGCRFVLKIAIKYYYGEAMLICNRLQEKYRSANHKYEPKEGF